MALEFAIRFLCGAAKRSKIGMQINNGQLVSSLFVNGTNAVRAVRPFFSRSFKTKRPSVPVRFNLLPKIHNIYRWVEAIIASAVRTFCVIWFFKLKWCRRRLRRRSFTFRQFDCLQIRARLLHIRQFSRKKKWFTAHSRQIKCSKSIWLAVKCD